ncbi:uncharacterized protein LOC130449895 [Diorhabda sublineata]|uniref:uncharacterized protein LOC130449895 n=1 Tax=Diorhabda sublineata TaxID=1163346 RepID=UPI0024E142BC|nr:uncharacterized protein LOC130449895 [Diorhabda sublineata]
MLQQLWKENLSWDSPVSHELQVKWNNFIQELPSLNYLKIQRHVICDNSTQIELHAFSDASAVAYGAAVYFRSKNCYGETFCHLLISKAKVAPIKSLTIPRLELCAAHLLAKLVNKVTTSLRLDFNSVTLWSDSTIVLGWIKTPVHLLKPFVRNRIAEIQELTDISSWRYVPSLENPADILSRGSYPSSLNNSNIWWQGPYWLQESPDLWPKDNKTSIPLPEIKTTLVAVSEFKFPFERISNLNRLRRCMAFILRFIKNCSSNKENRSFGVFTTTELDNSL